jgi:hypothetical protein
MLNAHNLRPAYHCEPMTQHVPPLLADRRGGR